MLSVACTNAEKVTVTATPVTATGRPARFDGALKVSVQSGSGSVEQDPATPNSFKAVSGDDPGTTVYLVEADVDLGTGITNISDTVELTVTGENAAAFGLAAGVVEPK